MVCDKSKLVGSFARRRAEGPVVYVHKPRPVRLVFSSLICKHGFLEFSKDFGLAGLRLDDDLTKSQQAERKSLSQDFQSLKTKGYQPYFRGSLLQYYSDNKNTLVGREKQTRSQQLHEYSWHKVSR